MFPHFIKMETKSCFSLYQFISLGEATYEGPLLSEFNH